MGNKNIKQQDVENLQKSTIQFYSYCLVCLFLVYQQFKEGPWQKNIEKFPNLQKQNLRSQHPDWTIYIYIYYIYIYSSQK